MGSDIRRSRGSSLRGVSNLQVQFTQKCPQAALLCVQGLRGVVQLCARLWETCFMKRFSGLLAAVSAFGLSAAAQGQVCLGGLASKTSSANCDGTLIEVQSFDLVYGRSGSGRSSGAIGLTGIIFVIGAGPMASTVWDSAESGRMFDTVSVFNGRSGQPLETVERAVISGITSRFDTNGEAVIVSVAFDPSPPARRAGGSASEARRR